MIVVLIFLIYMAKLFYDKWDQTYRRVKEKLGLSLNEETVFGTIEAFSKKKIGPYHLIKNISYAQYKGNAPVITKIEVNTIQAPFSAQKFHFSLIPYSQVIAFVDLDNGRLIFPQPNESNERIKEEEFLTEHVIKIGKSQIAHGHSIYVPYLREHLPQILTPRLIESILELSGILPGPKIGYNSQGGSSSVNNFHVQLINGHSLVNNNKFHFQEIEGQKFKSSYLNHFEQFGIEFHSFQYASAFFIKISSKEFRISHKNILKNMVKAIWSIIDFCLTNNIPHNLNIPNQDEVYIILRNFHTNYGWVQLSGVQIISNEHDFQHTTADQITQKYSSLALPRDIIEQKLKKMHL